MEHTKEWVHGLASMIKEGKLLEAFEKYYADDVTMQENNDEPRVGKDVNRKFEETFVNGITEVHSVEILGVASGDNYSTIETSMDVTHKDWGRIARSQVAVQHWKDGKVVKEKFYYKG
jgi:hypothetical protein